MKIRRSLVLVSSAAACVWFAAGCMSVRFATTLPPSGQLHRALGLVKVNVTNLVVSSPAGYGNILADTSRKKFMASAIELYPLIFTEDRNALPVNVEVECAYDDDSERAGRYTLLMVLTLGLVPTPMPGANETGDFIVRVSATDPGQGPIVCPAVTFRRRNAAWWTVFTPFGLIPVPGQTDIPRSAVTISRFDDPELTRKGGALTLASCVEAVVQALEAGDLGRMDIAWEKIRLGRDLADLLQGSNVEARIAAAENLGDRGDVRAKDALRLAAYDPEPAVREKAADALRKLGEPPTADELRRLGRNYPALDQYEADFRLMADSAAGRFGGTLREQRENNLRGRMITLVPELIPVPAVPDEAREFFDKGVAFHAKAKDSSGFDLAVAAFGQALRSAPWWADAYYRRALAEGAAGRYAAAARDLQFYLLSNPSPAAADEARARLQQMQTNLGQ